MKEKSMSEELSPCPFCGGEAELQFSGFNPLNQSPIYCIHCKNCWSSTFNYFETKDQAVKAWNIRTLTPNPEE